MSIYDYRYILHEAMRKGLEEVKKKIQELNLTRTEIIRSQGYCVVEYSCSIKNDPEIVSFLIDTYNITKEEIDVMRFIKYSVIQNNFKIASWLMEKFHINSHELNEYDMLSYACHSNTFPINQLKACKWLMDTCKITGEHIQIANLCRTIDKLELYGLLFKYSICKKKRNLLKDICETNNIDDLVDIVKDFTCIYMCLTNLEKREYELYVYNRKNMGIHLCKELVDIVYSYVHIF